jgi:hypothetical protein
MFWIPNFENLEDLLEYEKVFLEKYKKSINSSAYYQMTQIKNEIDQRKKELTNKDADNNKSEFNNYLNIG